MDFIAKMLKPRPSQSPVRTSGLKRPTQESSPSRPLKAPKIDEDAPKFTFEQVKSMIETMLEDTERNKRLLVSSGLKSFDFDKIALPGHSVGQCKELVDRLVKSTRRVRTFNEVLTDIRDNLGRKTYTGIIQRATLNKDNMPKRPPSAYLLYHQDRYHELKHEYPLAAEVSKIVSDEWKKLSDRKRREYQKRHNDLMRNYENELRRLGLLDDEVPKRPGSARTLYIQERLDELDTDDYSKEDLGNMQKQLGAEFDSLDKQSKRDYTARAKERYERFRQENEQFAAQHPHLQPRAKPGPRPGCKSVNGVRVKKPDMPQAPKSALKLYLEKKMPDEIEGEEAEDMKRRLKEKFAQLSAKKQLKFIKKAIKDKARYDQEVHQFIEQNPDFAELIKQKEPRANLTKEQWKLYYSMVENRPSLPAPTAYLYYCGKLLSGQTYSNGLGAIEPTQRMQAASESWRGMSDSQRAEIEQEHAEAIETYISEMSHWLEAAGPERKKQILVEEPRANPDYWRKKVNKTKRAAAKREAVEE